MAKLTPRQVQLKNLQDAFAPKIQSEAVIVAAGVPPEVGIGIETIITLLLPMLLNLPCFKQTAKTPAEFLASKWDGSDYQQATIRRARPETRRAAKQDGKGHLKPRELDLITVAAFDRARMNPTESAAFATEFYASQA